MVEKQQEPPLNYFDRAQYRFLLRGCVTEIYGIKRHLSRKLWDFSDVFSSFCVPFQDGSKGRGNVQEEGGSGRYKISASVRNVGYLC